MVAQVLSQKITDWDEYSGRFQAIDTVEVRPRVSGYIDSVLFREGHCHHSFNLAPRTLVPL